MSFLARTKEALVADRQARFVYLNNFEVERAWARDEPSLPGGQLAFATSTVNRMEEMGLLLAEPGDLVVLKAAPDEGYLDYLRGLGCAAGEVLVVDSSDPARTVTEDALASRELQGELTERDDGRTHLMPLGVGPAEEQLAKESALPLATPSAQTCKAVNGKVFSRELAHRTGLRAVPGTVCRTVADVAAALPRFLHGSVRAVVKESYGVSGRGMVVLDGPRRAEVLLRMLRRRGEDAVVDFVVESWIEHAADLNYQFVVSRRGTVRFETVKAAVVRDGAHQGHRFPVALPAAVVDELHEAAAVIGAELFAHGYYGLVGVDAVLGPDGTLYPCLEINARFNMSTYQSRIAELFVEPDRHAVAATVTLRPTRPRRFDEVADGLGELLFDGSGRPGVLVNAFATLNAAAVDDADFPGRLYLVAIDDRPDGALDQIDRATALLSRAVTR